jgi:hypothetical protein
MKLELQECRFDKKRIQKWIDSGRIFQKEGGAYWCGVHPWSSFLSWNQMLNTTCEEYFTLIAKQSFPTALYIADQYSCVTEAGLLLMKSIYPDLIVKHFPGSEHSIHSTSRNAFIEAVNDFLRMISAS